MWRKEKRHAPAALQRGPQLPFRILTELGEEAARGESSKRGKAAPAAAGGAAARKARRKLERVAKSQRRAEHASAHGRAEAPAPAAPSGAVVLKPKRPLAGHLSEDAPEQPPVKRLKAAPAPAPPAPPRAPPVSAERQKILDDIEGELRLQRRLGKQLGKGRKGRTSAGSKGDGMEELTVDLPGFRADDSGDDEAQVHALVQSQSVRVSKKERAAGAAGVGEEEAPAELKGVPVAAPPPGGHYVPPAARAASAAAAASGGDGSSVRLSRALKGLLNRLGESNAARVTQEASQLADGTGCSRRELSRCVAAEVTHALSDGPRASSAYACALAAFVAGLCASLGPEPGARTLAAVAAALDAARVNNNAQGAANLAALLARLYVAALAPAPLIWGLLAHLTGPALEELDVALTLAVLRSAGPKLRTEDPEGLRDFIMALQMRFRDPAGSSAQGLSTRARVLLDLVCDVKNGKKGGGTGLGSGGESYDFPPPLLKWLRDSGVGGPAAALRAVTYPKLLEPAAQRPDGAAWWHAHALLDEQTYGDDGTGAGARLAARRAAATADGDGAELLRAASVQRMNTDVRRGAFVALMGAEDVEDAVERLLKLGLSSGAERDLLRVVLHCCLAETSYNPFYEHVASRLCLVHKRHRVTLQFSLWDAWRELGGADTDARRLSHLARFVAGTLIRGSLPFSGLRGADWAAAAGPPPGGADGAAFAKKVAHLRLLIKALLLPPRTPAEVHALFLRAAGKPPLAPLRASLLLFMRRHVLGPHAEAATLAAVRAAEAGLHGEPPPDNGPPR